MVSLPRLENRYIHFLFFLGWTLLALTIFWQYDLVGRKLDADASFMLYAGQEILRGHAPYVSVAIVKLPVSPLTAALGVAVGRLVGLEDLIGGRLAFWLCAGLTAGAIYLIGTFLSRALTQSGGTQANSGAPGAGPAGKRPTGGAAVLPVFALGSLSALVFLSSPALGVQVAEGPEAKLPMLLAGMACVVLLARAQFFFAGLAGTLSFMAWQPGLVFIVATLACVLVVPDKKRALVSSLAGILLPILLIGTYLAANGALGSMFRQAFGANANYLGEKKVATGILSVIFGNIAKVWQVSQECSGSQFPLLALGYMGMVGGALFLAYRYWKTRDDQLFLAAFPILFSGVGLFGFSFLDLQKCSDLVPLVPYLALGAGAVLAGVSAVVLARLGGAPRLAVVTSLVLLVLVLLFGTRDALAQPRQTGLAQQRTLARRLVAGLGPEDRIQQFGDTVVLVLTGRANATRYVHLGEKQGLGILTAEGVSMQALTQELHTANPRVITLSRAKSKDWAKPLYDWLEQNYLLDTSYGASEGGTLKETDVYRRK